MFLVSDTPEGPPDQVWFSYYKDLRPEGRLKLGYGPGGPPVLSMTTVVELINELTTLGCLTAPEAKPPEPTNRVRWPA